MKVLGIETSTLMVGAAILDEKGLLSEYRLEATQAGSERLMPMIDRVLKDSHLVPQDLGGIALSIGPGSFTGLRIGVSTAKGLAFALNLPVAALPTLEVLATPLADAQCPYPICPVLDAKRKEVFAALFRAEPGGELKKIMEEAAIPPDRLAEKMTALDEPIIFLGTGALLYETELRKGLGDRAIFASGLDPYPSPSIVARLGMRRLTMRGGDDLAVLTPLYLSRLQAAPFLK